MVLKIIYQQAEQYKKFLDSAEYDELYKWVALKNFLENWNIDADDFRRMYDNSFYSKDTANLWANPHWFPKAVMLRFIDYDKERVRKMFRDLFNEEEKIDKRFERFTFHCDEMLKEIFVTDKSMKNHFHDGQRMISLS